MLIAAITAELSLNRRNSPHLGEKTNFSSVFWLNSQCQSLRLINVQYEGSSIERPVKTSKVAAGNQPTPADNEVLNLVDISTSVDKRSTKWSKIQDIEHFNNSAPRGQTWTRRRSLDLNYAIRGQNNMHEPGKLQKKPGKWDENTWRRAKGEIEGWVGSEWAELRGRSPPSVWQNKLKRTKRNPKKEQPLNLWRGRMLENLPKWWMFHLIIIKV